MTATTCATSDTVRAPVALLQEIVRRFGTPTYAYDLASIRAQAAKLRAHLPAEIEILYSLKANPSLGLCGVLAACGLGADVASAGEIATALAAGFSPKHIFLTGPDRSPAVRAQLQALPQVIISVDSPSELRLLAGDAIRHRALLRLRPDFCSYASCSAGPDSRFGLTLKDVPECRGFLRTSGIEVVGFHVFAGSQVLAAEGVLHHLRGGVDLALRSADMLGLKPQIIDIGGGFGIPYAAQEDELDLKLVGAELHRLMARVAPARIVIELGRFLVAPSGWFLTCVLALQTFHGRPAVVVDGGTHQRGDMCGLGLRQKGYPPIVFRDGAGIQEFPIPTDVLGCLSLPGDVLAEARPLPPLAIGDVLAFPNAGAYGLGASPWSFHAHPAPAEIAFEGMSIAPIRLRRPPESILDDQTPVSNQSVRA